MCASINLYHYVCIVFVAWWNCIRSFTLVAKNDLFSSANVLYLDINYEIILYIMYGFLTFIVKKKLNIPNINRYWSIPSGIWTWCSLIIGNRIKHSFNYKEFVWMKFKALYFFFFFFCHINLPFLSPWIKGEKKKKKKD